MIQFAERTHPGRRSGENEDATGSNPVRHWWFVADGMGGQGNGHAASTIVKEQMQKAEAPDELLLAIHQSHLKILEATRENPMLRNMGSTIVAMEIRNRMAQVAWVGDSRAYLYRDGQLKRMTRDHSLVEVLRAIQGLSEDDLRGHPESNVITRGLGMEESAASMSELPLRHGDRFVLCSDGLTDELTDSDIAQVMKSLMSVDDAADKLIAQALEHGGKDNVSVVVMQYDGPTNRTYWIKRIDSRFIWWLLGGVLIGALLVGAVLWQLSLHS
ncbi:MAG TPA: protein phosphatase 2C domain-containing protein [Steroidobacteraceae bacterium]|nr:protein phosphatase 2C domain-containing protein [Steroidobacteraceae bacterium]